ncbi:MAG: hypothetical protein PHV06_10680 [bacterium]|nr:hypothetical protein [bacterium]
MIRDNNKEIAEIIYNHLNLPKQIVFENSNSIEYSYNAAGVKLKKTVIEGTATPEVRIEVDYLDGFQYAGEVLNFFPTAEGYVRATPVGNITPGAPPTGYAYSYVYNYTDHLGNVRLSYSMDHLTGKLKILEENHYYPFGLRHGVYDTGGKKDFSRNPGDGIEPEPGLPPVLDYVTRMEYQYKYNGKEWQDELGLDWTAMDFRNYYSAIGRFQVIDPMAAFAPSHTPYRLGFNNPVYWADPTGRYEINGTDNQVNIILNKDEMAAYQEMVKSGSLDGLSTKDLVDAIIDGLEEAGFTNDYTLGEATITAKRNNNDSNYTFSNLCITGCHKNGGNYESRFPSIIRKTKSEKFYWSGGGHGSGFDNSFMKAGDEIEHSDLLEYLSMLRGGYGSASSMSLQAYSDIFTLVQMWNISEANGSSVEILGPTNISKQDEMIKFQVGVAIPTNSTQRGFAPFAEGLKTIEVHRKDSIKAVQQVKKNNDSIRNLPWPK